MRWFHVQIAGISSGIVERRLRRGSGAVIERAPRTRLETPEVINKILAHLAARNTAAIDHHPRAPPLRASAAELPASPSPTLS